MDEKITKHNDEIKRELLSEAKRMEADEANDKQQIAVCNPNHDNKGRGGAGRNQGRKPLSQAEETITACFRMTRSERDKLAILGGAKWIRAKIKAAKV